MYLSPLIHVRDQEYNLLFSFHCEDGFLSLINLINYHIYFGSDGKLDVVVPSFVHYLEVLEGSDGDKMPGLCLSIEILLIL